MPATVRKRWGTGRLRMDDCDDHLVLRPVADNPIKAARGALGDLGISSRELRAIAREQEQKAELRRLK